MDGERKTKKSKSGERHYVYYRCTYYNVPQHPRTRVTEADIDRQVLAIFDKMRIENEDIREWVLAVLRSQTKDTQAVSLAQRAELNRQLTLTVIDGAKPFPGGTEFGSRRLAKAI